MKQIGKYKLRRTIKEIVKDAGSGYAGKMAGVDFKIRLYLDHDNMLWYEAEAINIRPKKGFENTRKSGLRRLFPE